MVVVGEGVVVVGVVVVVVAVVASTQIWVCRSSSPQARSQILMEGYPCAIISVVCIWRSECDNVDTSPDV